MENLTRFFVERAWALLLSPLGLVIIGATRLLVVANDRPDTAIAIASSGGYVNTLLGTLIPLVPILLPYIALFFLIFRRFILSALAFLAAAFISPAKLKESGRLATNVHSLVTNWREWLPPLTSFHSFLQWVNSGKWQPLALFFILLALFLSWLNRSRAGYQSFSLLWVVLMAAIAVPIIAPIYRLPSAGFYAAAMRQPWLPEEKLDLASGQSNYGYVLDISLDWTTELTAGSRTIRYIPTSQVVKRTICQQHQVSYSPLIPLPKTTRPQSVLCLPIDGPPPPAVGTEILRTQPRSLLSHGQSLRVIESAVHRSPGAIISETNAHEHQRISTALRDYEIAGNWWAPTPIGQRFWYYPRHEASTPVQANGHD